MTLRYYFDVVCPYSYNLGFEVEQAEDDGLVEIEWLPFELRSAPKELPGPLARPRLRARHPSRSRDPRPRYQPRSTLALSLHSFAEEEGRGRAYRDAAHRAFFVEGLNISDEGVLREAAEEAGLDADEAITAAWDPDRISGLRTVREEAKSIGAYGVPTVATGEQVLHYGAASPGKVRALLASRKETVG